MKKILDSKKNQWFEVLKSLGFENPLCDDDIPEKYISSKNGKDNLKLNSVNIFKN